jgi:catechol 2,3-dioxygenase-like lactoylglutathione lyase family enzyme
MANGLVTPPPADIPRFVPPQRDRPPATDEPPIPEATPADAPATGPWSDLGAAAYHPEDRADEILTAYPSARPGPAGAIHGVGLTVLVRDLDRSITFYRDMLGFFEIDRGEGNAVLASGDTRVVLRTVADLTSAGRLIYLNLEVGDVEAIYRELSSKGVVFEHEPMVVNHGQKLELWSATFHDPDGHNIAITQWRSTN